jgi:predicted transcriptional regulator
MPPPAAAIPLDYITRLNATAKDLLIYIFDLNPLDVDVLFLLMKSKKEMTLDDIAKKLSRDKTTVSRSTQKLIAAGLCVKDATPLKGGGYYNIYAAVDRHTFKQQTELRIKEVQMSFERIMQKFEEDISKAVASFYR